MSDCKAWNLDHYAELLQKRATPIKMCSAEAGEKSRHLKMGVGCAFQFCLYHCCMILSSLLKVSVL